MTHHQSIFYVFLCGVALPFWGMLRRLLLLCGQPIKVPMQVLLAGVFFGLLMPVYAVAMPQGGMMFPRTTGPAFRWSEPIEMRFLGMPVVIRNFVADLSFEQAAQQLAQHKQHFQRITTLPGTVLLSGVHQKHHWVAQLQATQGWTQGTVSTLPLTPDEAAAKADSEGSISSWLAQNTRYLLGHSSRLNQQEFGQSLYFSHDSPDVLIPKLRNELNQPGWQRLGARTWSGSDRLKKGSATRIDVVPVALDGTGHSAIVVNHLE